MRNLTKDYMAKEFYLSGTMSYVSDKPTELIFSCRPLAFFIVWIILFKLTYLHEESAEFLEIW